MSNPFTWAFHSAGNIVFGCVAVSQLGSWTNKYTAPTRTPEFANIAGFLGENIKGITQEAAAKRAVNAVVNLKKEIGIPKTLGEIGLKSGDISFLSHKAYEIKRLLRFNPLVVRKSDIIRIYKEAL